MKNIFLFLIFSFLIPPNCIQSQSNEDIILGSKHTIYSDTLSEEREFWISLPDSYYDVGNSYKKYPVVILLDGHVHFKATAGIVSFMSSGNSDKRDIPETIVVAVLNVNRRRDFTPDKIVTKRKNDSGGGEKFLAFLETELIPTLDSEYRTIPYRILIGHSLGGLLTTHAYMKQNSSFNSFVSIDPSFGTWDNAVMDEKVNKINENIFKRPLFLATANWDKRNLRNRDRHVRFYESLKGKNTGDWKVKHTYYEEKNHSSVPLPAIYDGLTFIFRGYNFPYRNAKSLEHLVGHFQQFSEEVSFDFYPPEELVNRIGYSFLRSKNDEKRTKALSFFKLNTENFPESFNAFDSLGEAQFKLGSNEEAIKSFEKSLQLNPTNDNARKMIDRINNR